MTAEQTAVQGRRIVVGVDGSEPSKHALRWAQFLARTSASTLEVVAAWQPYTMWGSLGSGWVTMPADWNPARDAEVVLATTIEEVSATSIQPTSS